MVTHCICRERSFALALSVAREHGCTTVAELQEHLGISTNCGLCIPYVQRAIETGEVEIPVMNPAEAERWEARSGVNRRAKKV